MIREKKELDAVQAKEKALRLLEYRSHSEKELKDKLILSGAKEEDIPPIMEFLKNYNFINDEEYAKKLARDLQNLKKYGKARIRQELNKRGIDSEFAQSAIDELEDDEEENLLPLIEKKLKNNFEKKNIDKAIRYFIYRGYGFNEIKHCIDKLKSENLED